MPEQGSPAPEPQTVSFPGSSWVGEANLEPHGNVPQNWDGGGEYKAKPLEWVRLCQSNIGFGDLRKACGPHLRSERQPRGSDSPRATQSS